MQAQPSVIDFGTEWLFDRTRASSQLKLLLAAIGRPVASGSAWVAVNKNVAAIYPVMPVLPPALNLHAHAA